MMNFISKETFTHIIKIKKLIITHASIKLTTS